MKYEGRDSILARQDGRDRSLVLLNQAVEGLRDAGQEQELPRGLFARAAFFRMVGDFKAARADLQEAYEIAERGEMNLWLGGYHLEMGRLVKEIKIKH